MPSDSNIKVLYSLGDFIRIRGDKVPVEKRPEKLYYGASMDDGGVGRRWCMVQYRCDTRRRGLGSFYLGYVTSSKIDRSV